MGYKQFMGLLDDNVSPEASQLKYQEYQRAFGAASGQAMAACGSAGIPGQASESMAMPDKMVSGLIGKGGAVIRELMARSGALIQVSQKGEGGGGGAERTVTMMGSAEAVATAQHFVKERLKEIEAHNAQRAAGGGGALPQGASHSVAPHGTMGAPQGFAGQAYAQPAFLQQAYSPPQPSPFLQHSMPNMPQGMQLTPMGPQSSMNTMFAGQPGQFQQWQ